MESEGLTDSVHEKNLQEASAQDINVYASGEVGGADIKSEDVSLVSTTPVKAADEVLLQSNVAGDAVSLFKVPLKGYKALQQDPLDPEEMDENVDIVAAPHEDEVVPHENLANELAVPPAIPVDHGAEHAANDDQVVPIWNGDGGGGPQHISIYINGVYTDYLPPESTQNLQVLYGRLFTLMERQPTSPRLLLGGYRFTYWNQGLQPLLIPTNATPSSAEWQAFSIALNRVDINSNVEL